MPALILLAAVLYPLQTGKAEAAAWQTVVSEDGRYSVEMPSAPNFRASRSRSGSDGQARITIRGCRTSGGGYYVQKTEFPPHLIQGTEDSQLDSERDELARQYGGSPTGEKKITLEGGSRGREFTIRGRPKGEIGLVTVRVREYLVGKTIYAVLVASIVDRELPADTDRFLGTFKLVGAVAARPKAAPPLAGAGTNKSARGQTPTAPRSAGGSGEGAMESWGTPVDPDRDCKIHAEGKTLVIEVPNSPHELVANPFTRINKPNAPRVIREVQGDFEMQVRVDGQFTPNGNDPRPAFAPIVTAGLLVFLDDDNFMTVHRSAVARNGRVNSGVGLSVRAPGRRRSNRSPRLGGDGPTYLRLVRKGGQLLPSASTDGKQWESLTTIDIPWPDRLKVGVVALSTSIDPFTVTFAEFKFKKNADLGGQPTE